MELENMNITFKNLRKKIFPAFRSFGKIVIYGFLLGAAINLPFAGIDLYHNILKAGIFDQLQIGMSSWEAEKILNDAGVMCGINANTSRQCYFSDFWRHYEIDLNPTLQEVRGKSYWFKERWWMVDRLRGRNTHHVPR